MLFRTSLPFRSRFAVPFQKVSVLNGVRNTRLFSTEASQQPISDDIPTADPKVPIKKLSLSDLIPDYADLKRAAKTAQSNQSHQSEDQTSIAEMMSVGLHLGHSTNNWHFNMLPYIYGHRAGIHLINLEHTLIHLRRALNVTREITKRGGVVLFVGIRPFLLDVVAESARTSKQFYVHGQWLRGCLNNHEHTLRKASDTGSFVLPDLVVFLDMKESQDAIEETSNMLIPSIGLCDTDCDPMLVTYPIPGNDDAKESVHLIASLLATAAKEGAAERARLLELSEQQKVKQQQYQSRRKKFFSN